MERVSPLPGVVNLSEFQPRLFQSLSLIDNTSRETMMTPGATSGEYETTGEFFLALERQTTLILLFVTTVMQEVTQHMTVMNGESTVLNCVLNKNKIT